MYEKPALERFGTFRELTQLGLQGGTDLFGVEGIPGCNGDEDAAFFESCSPSNDLS